MKKYRSLLFLFFLTTTTNIFALTHMTNLNYRYYSLKKTAMQTDNFSSLWTQIDSLTNIGQPQKALLIVKKIEKKALNDNDMPQYLKASIYQIRLRSEFEENYLKNIINELIISSANLPQPAKQIEESVIADLIWTYYTNNKYAFIERNISDNNYSTENIELWNPKDFVRAATNYYLSSLNNAELLQKISLKNFDTILITSINSKLYRPTLYDFLANKCIDFFSSSETDLAKPVNPFNLNDEMLYSDNNVFSQLSINSNDSLSFEYKAIKTFQQLTKFRLKENNIVALIDLDLKRLDFVNKNSSLPNKKTLYLNSLTNLYNKFNNNEYSASIAFKIAEWYYNNFTPIAEVKSVNNNNNSKAEQYLKMSYNWCNKAIKAYPNAIASKNCANLIKIIETPSLSFKTEAAAIPNKDFPILIEYKNTNKIWIKLFKTEFDEVETFDRKQETYELIHYLLEKDALIESEVSLPTFDDFSAHSIEYIMKGLNLGYYTLVMSSSKDFDIKNSIVSINSFWISNLSLISKNDYLNNNGFVLVLNRTDGKPVENAKVKAYYKDYDYSKKEAIISEYKTYTTDAEGLCKIEDPNDKNIYYYLNFDISKGDDRFISLNNYTLRSSYENKEIKTWFFTDRGLYRPGQVVYFKGIVIENDNYNYEIKKNYKSDVTFYDSNGQKIETKSFLTNEYGSFNGSFTIPTSILNGDFRIQSQNGYAYFKVEEYKRPRFEVIFDPIENSYKLNEDVTIKGHATTFNNIPVSNAKVTFKVSRQSFFPYRYYFPTNRNNDAEIAFGNIETDENGTFEIKFNALAPQITDNYGNYFIFNVSAEVTDINGETQFNKTALTISDIALVLDAEMDDFYLTSTPLKINFTTKNLSQKHVPTNVKVEIIKLNENSKIYNSREWLKPDTTIYSKTEWEKLVPDYEFYNDSGNFENGKTIFNNNYNTANESIINIANLLSWEAGNYLIKFMANDIYGKEVILEKRFRIININDKKAKINTAINIDVLNKELKIGETAKIIVTSSLKNSLLFVETQSNNGFYKKEWIKLNDTQHLIEIPITKEFVNNFTLNFILTNNNRNYYINKVIEVPDAKKILNFTFETLRTVVEPGNIEKWKIKITDTDNKNVAAELLSCMYDSSLDKIHPFQWYFNLIDQPFINNTWSPNGSFTTLYSSNFTDYNQQIKDFIENEYDRLNWFGFNIYNIYNYYGRNNLMFSPRSGQNLKSMVLQEDAVLSNTTEAISDNDNYKDRNDEEIVKDSQQETQKTIRKNFNETAFFYPQLITNNNSEVEISFTVPDALTKWNFFGLAHNKDLYFNSFAKEIISQKEVSIAPNLPRILYEDDTIIISSRISNLTSNQIQGEAKLEVINAINLTDANKIVNNTDPIVIFNANAKDNTTVNWKIIIPKNIEAILIRTSCKAGNHSDAEEWLIPIIPNRTLITETYSLPISENGNKSFKFNNLINSKTLSNTISNYKLTLEFTSNAAWYAVQALPYIMEPKYDNITEIFKSYYSNSIAKHIVNNNKKIKNVFEKWQYKNYSNQNNALLSNLEKNKELKSIILNETPWILDAINDKTQKQNIAKLFNENQVNNLSATYLKSILNRQNTDGSWSWFKGFAGNRHITQEIVTGFAKLNYIKIINIDSDNTLKSQLISAINYLSSELNKDYNEQIDKNSQQLSPFHIYFLYANSMIPKELLSTKHKIAVDYFSKLAQNKWVEQSIYLQAMIALWAGRNGDLKTANSIIASLRDKAIIDNEFGMYWSNEINSYSWYNQPIETQSIIIELFQEIANDEKSVNLLKTWLLKQKQTQTWKSTTATTNAIYALLTKGDDWLQSEPNFDIKIGDKTINSQTTPDLNIETATGYFKTSWSKNEIVPNMGNIEITNNVKSIAWGALYWQYFENLNKVNESGTNLKLKREFFIKHNSENGAIISPYNKNFKVGETAIIRLIIVNDRDLEYVHLKDTRASAFEPIDNISGYKFENGLGFYQSISDINTDFFFDYLPKGTWVLEYPVFISKKGNFNAGTASIQCLYAPEFAAQAKGLRIHVE